MLNITDLIHPSKNICTILFFPIKINFYFYCKEFARLNYYRLFMYHNRWAEKFIG